MCDADETDNFAVWEEFSNEMECGFWLFCNIKIKKTFTSLFKFLAFLLKIHTCKLFCRCCSDLDGE